MTPKHSRVSEKHINDSDCVLRRAFAASGYDKNFQLQLQPDAVSSIIPEPKKRKLQRRSTAWEKVILTTFLSLILRNM